MGRTKKKMRWRDMKPHTPRERKNMLKKYGSRCYLLPKELKYPICNKYTGIECVVRVICSTVCAFIYISWIKTKNI